MRACFWLGDRVACSETGRSDGIVTHPATANGGGRFTVTVVWPDGDVKRYDLGTARRFLTVTVPAASWQDGGVRG